MQDSNEYPAGHSVSSSRLHAFIQQSFLKQLCNMIETQYMFSISQITLWEVPHIGTPVLFALSCLGIILFNIFLSHYSPNKAHQIIKLFYLFIIPWIFFWSWVEHMPNWLVSKNCYIFLITRVWSLTCSDLWMLPLITKVEYNSYGTYDHMEAAWHFHQSDIKKQANMQSEGIAWELI